MDGKRNRAESQLRLYRYYELYAVLASGVLVGNMFLGEHSTILVSMLVAAALLVLAAGTNLWRQHTIQRLAGA